MSASAAVSSICSQVTSASLQPARAKTSASGGAPDVRSSPEVGAPDMVVLVQLLGRPLQGHRPDLEHVGVIGQAQGKLGILLHQDHWHAPLADLADGAG